MRRCELSAAITQLMSKCLWSGWKWQKGYKEIASPFPCCLVNRKYSRKKSQIVKKVNYALQHVRTDSWCMVDAERLESFMTDVLIVQKLVHWFAEQINMDWFLYDRNIGHERLNALLLGCIDWDMLLDYDKIIDIYASKFQTRMLLINVVSKT